PHLEPPRIRQDQEPRRNRDRAAGPPAETVLDRLQRSPRVLRAEHLPARLAQVLGVPGADRLRARRRHALALARSFRSRASAARSSKLRPMVAPPPAVFSSRTRTR